MLGQRSVGEWNPVDQARFITLLSGSIAALFFVRLINVRKSAD